MRGQIKRLFCPCPLPPRLSSSLLPLRLLAAAPIAASRGRPTSHPTVAVGAGLTPPWPLLAPLTPPARAESSRGGGPRRPPPPPCPAALSPGTSARCARADRRTASPSSLPPTSPPFSFPLFPVKADARRRAPPWPSSLAFLARQRRIDKAVLILCPSRQRLPPFPSWPPPPLFFFLLCLEAATRTEPPRRPNSPPSLHYSQIPRHSSPTSSLRSAQNPPCRAPATGWPGNRDSLAAGAPPAAMAASTPPVMFGLASSCTSPSVRFASAPWSSCSR